MQEIPINKIKTNSGQIPDVPANPRTITKDKFELLKKSITEDPEFLKLNPILLYDMADGTYVALGGNQRVRACKSLGMKTIHATIVANGTDPQLVKSRIIKHNAGYGDDDWDALGNEWSDEPLTDWGLDLPEDWLGETEEIVEDEAPEINESEPPKSKLGEVYQLGRHRLMCGDSTDTQDVSKLMDGSRADLVFTDPPYGVDYQSKAMGGGILNDKLKGDSLYRFTRDAIMNGVNESKDIAGFYVWYEDKFRHTIQSALEDAGLEYKQNLIWNKGMNLSGSDYQKAHENMLYCQMSGQKAAWFAGRDNKTVLGLRRRDINQMKKSELTRMILNMQKEQTVWDFDRDSVTTYTHPTQKPTILAANAIRNSSPVDGIVLDLFLGSGSTLMAAEQTSRVCYGMELDPKFVDVIRKRYAKFTSAGDELPENWEQLTSVMDKGGTK